MALSDRDHLIRNDHPDPDAIWAQGLAQPLGIPSKTARPPYMGWWACQRAPSGSPPGAGTAPGGFEGTVECIATP